MTTRLPRRWALTAALPLLIGACGDDPASDATTTTSTPVPVSSSTTSADTTTTTAASTVIEVEVAGGSVVGGPREAGVGVGEPVTIRVTSDEADEVHVHGYDVFADVAPGSPAEITFTADIPGQFEVELEESGRKLLDLEVS